MGKEILTFGDIEIEKKKIYHHESPIFLKDVDVEISFGEKKNMNTLFVTCIMTINLSHYM